MKRLYLILAVLLTGCLSLPVQAAQIVTATFTFSGTPTDTDTVIINGTTRTWKTTVATASTEIAINGQNGSAANMYSHLVNYPEAGLRVTYNDADIVTVSSLPTTVLTASETGTTVTVVLSTNTLTQSIAVRVPFSSVQDIGSTNRIYIADELAKGLSDYNSQVIEFPDGTVGTPSFSFQSDVDSGIYWSTANTFHMGSGGTNVLTIGPATATVTGSLVATNGTLSNMVLDDPVTTNLVNHGNAISSPGTVSQSEQFGASATATAIGGLAVGYQSDASGVAGTAIGNGATATSVASTSLGFGANATATNSIAIGTSAAGSALSSISIGSGSSATTSGATSLGTGADATASNALALGYLAQATAANASALGEGATVAHADSTAVGSDATTTAINQVRLGTSAEYVSIAGNLDIDGVLYSADVQDVALKRFDNTALATGNNAAVNISTNSFVRISSGPSAAFTVNGIAGGRDGRMVTLYNATAYDMTIANDSGTDPTAANRIYTTSGKDFEVDGTGTATFLYDSSASRWILTGESRPETIFGELYTTANTTNQTTSGTASTYTLIQNMAQLGNYAGVTLSSPNRRITVLSGGIYKVEFTTAFSGTSSADFSIGIHTNAVLALNGVVERKLGTGGDIGSAAGHAILNLNATDYVDLRVASTGTSDTFTLKHGNVTLEKLK